MSSGILDNDVIHKTTVYALFQETLANSTLSVESWFALDVAKYVLRSKISKKAPNSKKAALLNSLNCNLSTVTLVNPTDPELIIAAEFEAKCSELNFDLDIGESQIYAMCITRGFKYFLTGDKRAIKAIEAIANETGHSEILRKSIVCVEQIVQLLMDEYGFEIIRASICSAPNIDKALSICCSCNSESCSENDCKNGLNSYIDSLRQHAPKMLFQ